MNMCQRMKNTVAVALMEYMQDSTFSWSVDLPISIVHNEAKLKEPRVSGLLVANRFLTMPVFADSASSDIIEKDVQSVKTLFADH